MSFPSPKPLESGTPVETAHRVSAMSAYRRFGPQAWSTDGAAMLFGLLLTLGLLVALPRPLCPDVSGQLWIAHHMRMGARLYVDISEINPPLWFWLAMPVDWLGETIGVYPERVLIVAIGAVTTLSLIATGRLLGHIPPARRIALLAYAGLILMVMPIHETGQREQYALICALPYVVLAAMRRQGRALPWPLALAIGFGGALGLVLKHYFLGVPVLLELWLLVALRRGWRPLRPETLALGAVAFCYAASVAILTPDYLRVMVPQLRLAYATTDARTLRSMILSAQYVWMLLLLLIRPQHRAFRRGEAPIASACLIAAGGFFLAWIIQHKGWTYQGIPTSGFLALAFATMLVELWPRVDRMVSLLAVAALILPIGFPLTYSLAQKPQNPAIDGVLTGLAPGDVVGLVTRDGIFSFSPHTVDRGLRFSGRYTRFWVLDAVDDNAAGRHDPRIDALARSAIAQTAADYRCLPPRRIVFESPATVPADAPPTTDAVAYLSREPGFADVMRHYRPWGRSGVFVAFERASPLPSLPASQCQRGM